MNPELLPDAELEVLACLWDGGPSTAREVRERLAPYRPMSHAAVFTLLKRLEEKELVVRRKGSVGKAFVYRARVRPDRTFRHKVGHLLDRVFRGQSVTLVSSLFESRPPTEDELDELQRLLDRARRRQARRGDGGEAAP